MYDYQLSRGGRRIAFAGGRDAVIEYLRQQGIRYLG
jgi:hypothetical protein